MFVLNSKGQNAKRGQSSTEKYRGQKKIPVAARLKKKSGPAV
jgi:hypothetical protein